ncbi:hypothetical protein [Haloactinospora alba]|uniref:hypothetical protein n=1 Tax=Haloactinospora alba TaxID=405555 RepID=UPI0014769902|nr:hypothetical protein [Haloactinospora alba]
MRRRAALEKGRWLCRARTALSMDVIAVIRMSTGNFRARSSWLRRRQRHGPAPV